MNVFDVLSPLWPFNAFGGVTLARLQSLFLPDDKAALFDYSGIANLFEDSAGTTPATVGSPVGALLDVSQGLVLGPELRGSATTGLAGTVTPATYNLVNGSGAYYRVDSANQSWVALAGLTPFSYYRVSLTNTGGNALNIRIGNQGGVINSVASGLTVNYLLQVTALGQLTINGMSGGFSGLSIRELKGNHAVQATIGNKPTLRTTPQTGRYWLQADSTDALVVTFATAPGSVYVGRMDINGAMAWTNSTLGTTWDILDEGFNGFTIMRSREFTGSEQALVNAYAKRQAPNAGEIVI